MKIFNRNKIKNEKDIKLSDFFIIDESNHKIMKKSHPINKKLNINFKNFVYDYNIQYEELITNNDLCIQFYTKEKCVISSCQDIYPIKYEYKYINNNPFTIPNYVNIEKLYLESINHHIPCKEVEYSVKYTIQLTKNLKYIDDTIEISNSSIKDVKEIREISTLEMYNSLFSNEDYFNHYLLIDNEDEFKKYDESPYTVEEYCLLKLISTIRSLDITDGYYIDKLIDCIDFDYSNYQELLEWAERLKEYPPETLAQFIIKKLQ